MHVGSLPEQLRPRKRNGPVFLFCQGLTTGQYSSRLLRDIPYIQYLQFQEYVRFHRYLVLVGWLEMQRHFCL